MVATKFVAKIILLDKKRQFLLMVRSATHPTLAGYYDLPGGTVELGEEPGEAVIREVREETGLRIGEVTILYATTALINQTSFPTLLYGAQINEECPNVLLSYEHQSYEWADLSRLEEVEPHLAPTYRKALGYLHANKILDQFS